MSAHIAVKDAHAPQRRAAPYETVSHRKPAIRLAGRVASPTDAWKC